MSDGRSYSYLLKAIFQLSRSNSLQDTFPGQNRKKRHRVTKRGRSSDYKYNLIIKNFARVKCKT